jgi:KUP system potassium uptake protein
LIIGFFALIDVAFFGANLLKVAEGGWFPLVMAAGVFTLMATWKRGREILGMKRRTDAIELDPFLAGLTEHPPLRVMGTAVFMTPHANAVPRSLLHNLLHNKVLHERVLVLTVRTEDIPTVSKAEQVAVEALPNNFFRVSVRYGFKDIMDIPQALEDCSRLGLEIHMMETSFFLSHETVIPTVAPGMALWREKLFAAMVRNAGNASDFFRIPANRVVELGTQIEI